MNKTNKWYKADQDGYVYLNNISIEIPGHEEVNVMLSVTKDELKKSKNRRLDGFSKQFFLNKYINAIMSLKMLLRDKLDANLNFYGEPWNNE